MDALTIDEIIKRENEAILEISSEMTERAIGMLDISGYKKCMEEHKRLAEWLCKLKEYKILEEQGKLLKLPCAVGDMTYNASRLSGRVIDAIVERIEIDEGGSWVITSSGTHSFDDFGKTAFLTQEEAALKEL